MPIQQLFLGAGGPIESKPFIDDCFSTFLYKGNATARSINNGIDFTKGGLLWCEARSHGFSSSFVDTERGATKYLRGDDDADEDTYSAGVTAFNNNGFSLGSDGVHGYVNTNNVDYSSWSFRRAKGFFTCIKFTGTGTAQSIDHDLGCIPGMMFIKRLSTDDDWNVYHRELHATNSAGYYIELNNGGQLGGAANRWNNTPPTATQFTVGTAPVVNSNGDEYICYLFAGGESSAAGARSVLFDGSNDYITAPSSSDFDFGTGDFTVEAWCYREGGAFFTIFDHLMGAGKFIIFSYGYGDIRVYSQNGGGHIVSGVNPGDNKWFHLAVVRESGKLKFYINGRKSGADHNFTLDLTEAGVQIGRSQSSEYCGGRISNVRVVKGTAVYTSSFRPPTEPLTNITGTVLLCCQNSQASYATVAPGTLTASGGPSVSDSISPFDDPAGYCFGENEDQNVVSTGFYEGNGSSTAGPEIFLGWEPQFVLIKRTNGSPWALWDSMRGIPTENNDAQLYPSQIQSEYVGADRIDLTSTGFKVKSTNHMVNTNNTRYIYLCIRRPDGYCGRPPSLGTDSFTIDASNATTTPAFDSGFPVDFALIKDRSGNGPYWAVARLMGASGLNANTSNLQQTHSEINEFDHNGAHGNYEWWDNVNNLSWMWKRGKGFDCITFKGTATNPGPEYAHSLGQVPELKIIKRRNASSTNWVVTGTVVSQAIAGTNNSKDYYLYLNSSQAAGTSSNYWSGNDTSATFTVRHGNGEGGGSADPYFCLLFASVPKISKLGFYNGTNSSGHQISCGFQPRFILIKCVQRSDGGGGGWHMFDTVRGINSGNEYPLTLSSNTSETSHTLADYVDIDSNGFTIESTSLSYNGTNGKYIYYAHA